MSAALVLPAGSPYDRPEMVKAISQTVAKGANESQLQMFLAVCKRTGLDPFLKEIWFVADRGMIMAGRDGYLRVANENPMFDGMETRVERDEKGVPIKAVCTVWRKDRTHPIVCEAYYSEYKKSGPVWSQYPSAMISKVAEVLALKRSFSINGVVTAEELGEDPQAREAREQVLDRRLSEVAASKAAREAAKQAVPEEPNYEEVEAEPMPSEDEVKPSNVEDMQLIHRLSASIKRAESKKDGLHEDIQRFGTKKTKKGKSPEYYELLQSIREQHERFEKIGEEATYYSILGQYGVTKSNEFPDTALGTEQMSLCYKELSLEASDLETALTRAKEMSNEPA